MKKRAPVILALTAILTATAVSVAIPSRLYGREWERIPTNRHVVALTFDAGSDAAALPSILHTLSARHVRNATFFLTGRWVQTYPVRAHNIANSYLVANHSMTHPYFTDLTRRQIRSQLSRAAQAIQQTCGVLPAPFFRFPTVTATSEPSMRSTPPATSQSDGRSTLWVGKAPTQASRRP
jgi:peptidoglycan/xylan/chitin deacetylase (PgdA/CDA1 family)